MNAASADSSHSAGDPLQQQPIVRVQRAGVEIVLLGTAHVSRQSVEAVRALLAQ